MRVTVLGGGGTIGSTTAYTLAIDRPTLDVRLCDIDEDAAWGHTMDIRHSRCHAGHPLGGADLSTADVTRVEPGPDAVDAADCVVMTASVPRPDAGTERGGRDAFWPANRDVADEIAGWLDANDPRPVVVVTNPVDRVVGRLHDRSGWPRSKFVGYSLSETARIADEIARRVDADPAEVDCPVLGEHGEHVVPAFSRATVDGSPLDLSAEQREALLEYVRSVPYDVIQRRGREESSRWVTGRGVALVVEAIIEEGVAGPVCLSTPLTGEYGVDGVALSVPATLSCDGVEQVREWDLPQRELEALRTAAAAIRAAT